jgi:predicted aldo/keto reductase-like oxidoreductase
MEAVEIKLNLLRSFQQRSHAQRGNGISSLRYLTNDDQVLVAAVGCSRINTWLEPTMTIYENRTREIKSDTEHKVIQEETRLVQTTALQICSYGRRT